MEFHFGQPITQRQDFERRDGIPGWEAVGKLRVSLVKLEGTSPTNTQHSLFVPTAIARGSSLSQDGRHRRRGIQRRFNHQNPTGAMDKVPDSHWRKVRQEQPPRADEGDEGGPWIYRNVGRGPSRRSTPHWH